MRPLTHLLRMVPCRSQDTDVLIGKLHNVSRIMKGESLVRALAAVTRDRDRAPVWSCVEMPVRCAAAVLEVKDVEAMRNQLGR